MYRVPQKVVRLFIGYCKYPLCVLHLPACLSVRLSVCLSGCKHDFCNKALFDFSETCDVSLYIMV